MLPLDETALRDLALAYVARYATSSGKLTAYLRRKLRERGWDGERGPDPEALAARFSELGYIDDAAFAQGKADGLLRRGYGARRVGEALMAAGIASDLREQAAPSQAEARHAVLALARRRRFGPFGERPAGQADAHARREKQLAAMLRAGHPIDFARKMVDAGSIEEAEQWAQDFSN